MDRLSHESLSSLKTHNFQLPRVVITSPLCHVVDRRHGLRMRVKKQRVSLYVNKNQNQVYTQPRSSFDEF